MKSQTGQLTLQDVQRLKESDANVVEEPEIQRERDKPKQTITHGMFTFESKFLTQGKGTDRRKRP